MMTYRACLPDHRLNITIDRQRQCNHLLLVIILFDPDHSIIIVMHGCRKQVDTYFPAVPAETHLHSESKLKSNYRLINEPLALINIRVIIIIVIESIVGRADSSAIEI